MFRGYTLPPVMENQMEEIMENETETQAESFTGSGSCTLHGFTVQGLRVLGLAVGLEHPKYHIARSGFRVPFSWDV